MLIRTRSIAEEKAVRAMLTVMGFKFHEHNNVRFPCAMFVVII